jgi:hypothetical protein
MIRKVLLCAATGVLAVGVACSKSTPNPTSPSPATQPDAGAAADGSTLKATTPTLVSPTGGAQITDPLVLTASKSTGKYTDINMSYRFQVRSGSTVVYDSGITGGVGSGNNVTHTVPSSAVNPDTDYTWRVRGESGGGFASWSADGSFKSPVGAYIRGNEIRDPLTIGRTVGEAHGVEFNSKGLELLTQESRVTYRLSQNLQAGEFSVMVTGFDEGSPGDKTKILSMQEGDGDLTTNDYRFTFEKRGSSYITPGATTWRMIMGDADEHNGRIFDGDRLPVAYSDERWYFWKVTWGTRTVCEVREDGPNGRIIYQTSRGTGGFVYRPVPHVVHLGASVGRAGAIDASIPGAIYKNVWVGAGPRPNFPNE